MIHLICYKINGRKIMPATSKKNSVMQKQVTKMSEQMQMLLFVFSLAMMMFAVVLYKVYAQ